jgi:hypothetical protein
MANRHRGEVSLALGGETLTLRLTLGALAELEDAFAVADLGALGTRLEGGRLSARDLVAILGAAARGGGSRLDDAQIAGLVPAGALPEVAQALGLLFARTFGEAPNPPMP